jgi:hypothetical protein
MIVFERAIPYGNTRSVVVGPIADSITSASTALMLLMSALGQKQTSDWSAPLTVDILREWN